MSYAPIEKTYGGALFSRKGGSGAQVSGQVCYNGKKKGAVEMTIQQLQYILEIQRTGSVSKAAKSLFVSQPSVSNAVRSLEQELGISIFRRTPEGCRPTAQGRSLIRRAGHIIDELNALYGSVGEEKRLHFRMLYSNYLPAFDAFVDLCRDCQHEDRLQLSCFSPDSKNILDLMRDGGYDLCVTVVLSNLPAFEEQCRRRELACMQLSRMELSVQLAREHPLLSRNGACFEHLREYPYVDFSSAEEQSFTDQMWTDFVNPDKLIRVRSSTARRDIVANSCAFSIVLPHSEEYSKSHGVVNIPIPGCEVTLVCVYSVERGLSLLAERYLEHLRQKLEQVEEGPGGARPEQKEGSVI